MKLYATTTSERASKGQGGNDRMYIDVNVGEIANALQIRINRSPTLKGYILSMTMKTGVGKKTIEEVYYHCYEEETKGNKLKTVLKTCADCSIEWKTDSAQCPKCTTSF